MYPKNIHPKQRQPYPSQVGENRAVQPYKPKPLRGLPRISDFVNHWEPDIVRFKGQTVEWTVQHINNWRIHLLRRDSRGKKVTKTIWAHEQYKLEIVYQPPRSADTTLHALYTRLNAEAQSQTPPEEQQAS